MATSHPPVILITGCSSGLGRSIATEALSRGLRVIATARRLEAVSDLDKKGAKTLALDITAAQADLEKFAAKAIALFGRVDILVNNAGYYQFGAVEETSPEQMQSQFATNFFGVVNLTNAFLPHFRERKAGFIANIGSQSSYGPFPGAGVYGASKAAVDYISQVWAKELKEFNIRTVSIGPGLFRTSAATNMKFQSKELPCYEGLHKQRDMYLAYSGHEPGDPKKAAVKILDLVTSDKDLPGRLPIGDDAVALLDQTMQAEAKEFQAWKEFGKGTNHDQA
ncbi:short-chain oxidoreductase [Dendrothele bispora CBS 962.96]|uniref:Short-chain oxidoreductase n=1 Tax=Dendrothele bispora (strain CBS 962.96) TaxID=1314807 RepID=A0A4S8M7X0_DENBC|nr:short-chain oxidoreductase [Dendrothele bispora CBS 962.96]